jgi:hypothetical protein
VSLAERRSATPFHLDWYWAGLRGFLLGFGRAGVAETDKTWHGACLICAQKDLLMLGIPRRYSHFVFGVIQSGLTSMIASGIASFPLLAVGNFFSNWLVSWFISWAMMLPLVLVAAPAIRSLAFALTRDEAAS